MYKVTRTLEGKVTALYHNIRNGQYCFVPVNSEKVTKFDYQSASEWKKHFDTIRRYSTGIRKTCPGFIQIVACDYDYSNSTAQCPTSKVNN